MATISFFASQNIDNLNGSGLGFYGSAFGSSVSVASYQDTTFITDSNGTIQGPQANNIKWTHPGSGSINGAASVELTKIPNYLATLKIQFSHTSAVKTQNAKGRIYDRSSINNAASGVTTKIAEVIHPDTVQNNNGSGDSTWLTPAGSSVVVDFVSSPGLSGHRPNAGNTTDRTHDWFAAISASPDSVGSKTLYAFYFECEYL
jgi:hypothetical protein